MLDFLLLTLLKNEDVAGLAALGEQAALQSLIELFTAHDSEAGESELSVSGLGGLFIAAGLVDIDRPMLAWAASAPSRRRFTFVSVILYEMWQSPPFRLRVDRERLQLLLQLRSDFVADPEAEERFLKLLAMLIRHGSEQPADSQALAVATLAEIPAKGYSCDDIEETFMVHCAPKLRQRGIAVPLPAPRT